MAGYNRRYRRYTHTHEEEPSWDEASFWKLRSGFGDIDSEIVEELIRLSLVSQVDQAEIKRIQEEKDGDIGPYLLSVVKRDRMLSSKRALLLHMTVEWGGPDFIVPDDYQDETQPLDPETGKYPIHPDAGTLPPITAFWIGERDPEEIQRVYDALQEAIHGRSPEGEKSFSRSNPRSQRPAKRRSPKKEVPETPGA